jgi:putative MATE family efflux protein
MVGQLGDVPLSAIGMATQWAWLLNICQFGFCSGATLFYAQYWGVKDVKGIHRVFGIAMSLVTVLSLIFTAICVGAPEWAMSLFNRTPEVVAQGAAYLRIAGWSYLAQMAVSMIGALLRSTGRVQLPMVTACLTTVLNIGLDYALIFGKFGMPELGIEGAAIATLAARIVETGYIVVYLAFFDRKLKVKAAEMFRTSKEAVGKFLRVSLPVVLSGTSWGIAMGMQTAILGRLTDPVISANSIASTVFQIISVFSYGSATAASVMIGKTIGEGKDAGADLLKKEVMHRAHVLQIVFLCIGSATGLALFLFKDFIIGFYNITPDTMTLAVQFMTVLSVTVIGSSYQMPCLTGIVRGGGDTKFVLFNDIIFMWGLVLPSSFAAAFIFELHPIFIFMCLKADQILKCIVAVVKVNSGNWMKKI